MNIDKMMRYGFGLLALLFSGYVLLTALGRDTGSLFQWITVVFTQVGIAVGLFYKQSRTEAKVDRIQEQTNGHMTKLIDAATGGQTSGVSSGTPSGE